MYIHIYVYISIYIYIVLSFISWKLGYAVETDEFTGLGQAI